MYGDEVKNVDFVAFLTLLLLFTFKFGIGNNCFGDNYEVDVEGSAMSDALRKSGILVAIGVSYLRSGDL